MAGIDLIRIYIPQHFIDLKTLAEENGIDPAKYYLGLGQEKMSVPTPDEDIVTLGANAAAACLKHVDRSAIDMLLFATESGIDQSKAAGVHLHELLGLSRRCQVLEVKQACCSSSIALELENLGYIQRHPNPEDARQVVLKFTDRGMQLIADSVASIDELTLEFTGHIGPGKFEAVRDVMACIYRSLHLEEDIFGQANDSDPRVLARQLYRQLGEDGAKALGHLLISGETNF